jgi:concanavalin A-like lectin/glucanase superfamily protein/calcineurin-like phosphoesterase family protein
MLLALLPLLLGPQAPHHPHHADGDRFLTDRSSPVQLELPLEDDAFTFAIFGDRTGGPTEGIKVLAQAVDEVRVLGPDLVMTVGDLVQGYNTTPQWLRQASEFKSTMSQLALPWFPVAGNHDIYWRGPGRPASEHEADYETHFGPLWYAFKHKGCWFLILYSDEANPDTGQRSFNNPANQRMSAEQYTWMDDVLEQMKDARHIFVFLHHPRWLGGAYGDDWDRVHDRLAAAGNVSAVFAGHIHQMKYSGARDGIEYFALATVGGAQFGDMPEAGFLHQYDLVTVRDKGIAIASLPVGSVADVRAVTVKVSAECRHLADQLRPTIAGELTLDSEMGGKGELQIRLHNPSSRPLEVTLTGEADDPRWYFNPDHRHFTLDPGAEFEYTLNAYRWAEGIDSAMRAPRLHFQADYLGVGVRVPLPDRDIPIPVRAQALPQPPTIEGLHWLHFDGQDDVVRLPSDQVNLNQEAFTLEAWFRADQFAQRQGFLNKTETSGFGIFLNQGKPDFMVYIDGKYVQVNGAPKMLKAKQWYHIAGVYDGEEIRLYVDGELIGRKNAPGKRLRNDLPLLIGADVDGKGQAVNRFRGDLDEVHLSVGARYQGQRFSPQRQATADDSSRLLLHMNQRLGLWIYNWAPNGQHPQQLGNPTDRPVEVLVPATPGGVSAEK